MEPQALATEPPRHQAWRSIVASALKVGLFTGGAGIFVGGIQGILYSDAPTLFAAFSTLQWLTAGTTYWAARNVYLNRHGLLAKPQKELFGLDVDGVDTFSASERKTASAIGGAVSGAVTAAATRGKRNILPGMIVFSLLGYTGQAFVNRREAQYDADEVADSDSNQKTFWQRLASSKFSPVKIMTDAEYEELLKEKLLRVETEIALIDDHIARLKQMQSPNVNQKKEN
ncbi:uncharacterized protein J3D65DRAFT_664002 [Phyllosticta citribraziliensis]|uniref:Transmembrane protein n=1 Tax=Phyllosticta citribraziliensis TaxID=989973 RepID=A0ABR1MA91_9PEZI